MGDVIVRVLVILLISWIAVAALARRPASLGALVWTLGLTSVLVLPWLTRVLPPLELPLFSPVGSVSAPDMGPAASDAPAAPVTDASSPVIAAAGVAPAAGVGRGIRKESGPSPLPGVPWDSLALALWIAGAGLLLLRLAVSHLRLLRLARAGVPADADWVALVSLVREELGITRMVRARLSAEVQVPAVAGVFRPVLLLPCESESWTFGERREVTLHELAHVARWDGLAQLVGHVACAVYWFIPLTWLGARQASALRERACDDVVLSAGTPASSYARSLLNLARMASGAELEPAALAMACPNRIEERVMGILDNTAQRGRVTGRAATVALFLTAGIIGGVAAIEPVRRAVLTPEEDLRLSGGAVVVDQAAGAVAPGKPAAAVQAGTGRDTSLFCSGGARSTQNSMHEDDGDRRWTVKVTGPDCRVEMRVEGKVEFNNDFTDITSISRNGYFQLDVTDRGVRRELEIRQSGGSLTRVYKLNGAEHEFDAEARAWFGAFLVALDRTTAVAVDIRLPRLLQQGGPAAVLDETALMPSDYARGVYYSALLKARRLSSPELTRMLDQAAALTESDYYASELLKAAGRDAFAGDAERTAVMAILRKMDSDYYRSEVMKSVFAAGQPSAREMTVMLGVVNSMESDYYKAEVLGHVLATGGLDAAQRAEVSRAAASMESGYYAAEVLKNMVSGGELSPDERSAFFQALGHIRDDYQRSEILGVLIRQGTPSRPEVEAIIEATGAMDSDYYRSETLGALLTRSRLEEADLLALVASVRTMDSDYHKDETLRKVLRNGGSSARVRAAVMEATEGMSRYHRDEVRRAAGSR